MPAFTALCGPECSGSFGAGWAHAGQGVAAGHEDRFGLAGGEIGAAKLEGPDAGAVLDGQVPDHIPGQRHGQLLSSGLPRYVQLGLLDWEE